MSITWKPSVTVAAVIERDGRYLLVEEETNDGLRLNQPAGHLDPGESLLQAAIREAREETAWEFRPTHLLGSYLCRSRSNRSGEAVTYLRFAFVGELGTHDAGQPLDVGIVRTLWLTPDEIRASRDRHRSPLVWQCVADHLAGKRFTLDLLYTDASALGASELA